MFYNNNKVWHQWSQTNKCKPHTDKHLLLTAHLVCNSMKWRWLRIYTHWCLLCTSTAHLHNWEVHVAGKDRRRCEQNNDHVMLYRKKAHTEKGVGERESSKRCDENINLPKHCGYVSPLLLESRHKTINENMMERLRKKERNCAGWVREWREKKERVMFLICCGNIISRPGSAQRINNAIKTRLTENQTTRRERESEWDREEEVR